MQVSNSNNVNIYNLSSGKSLPEWLSEKKRRLLQRKDVDIRRRIELIQDFEMPGVSTKVKISRDGKFILATGVYKPRVRCYDVDNLSMKFERCFDAESVDIELITDDYSKFALLQCDRSIELHAKYGHYYKTRIPKFGRDIIYHHESCDLLVVGASSEIYRLNLEQGRFLSSYQTNASSINRIAIHTNSDMIAVGSMEGKVEAFDPRVRKGIFSLDCAFSSMADNTIVDGFPSVTSLTFKGDLTMAVGTFTGQILLYDMRANKPFTIKDHMYGLPISNVDFIETEDLMASSDKKCVKFWNPKTGKPYTTIQVPYPLNDMCIVPKTGLFFIANENTKILTYFIPNIGPAPQWCNFLDSITEELEESKQDAVYDDYKFITDKELEQLHLEHLKGTNLLRAYMHGYFMDVRLYNKAKSIVQPEAYKDLKKKMIQNRIEAERKNKIVVKSLPSINKGYAEKLLERKVNDKITTTPFEDDRFKDLFENPDFEIKNTDDGYARVKSTVEKKNRKKVKIVTSEQMEALNEENIAQNEYTSTEDDRDASDDEESEDSSSESEEEAPSKKKKKEMFTAVDSEQFSMLKKSEDKDELIPIAERLKESVPNVKKSNEVAGNQTITFTIKQQEKHTRKEEERKAHLKERKSFRRPLKMWKK